MKLKSLLFGLFALLALSMSAFAVTQSTIEEEENYTEVVQCDDVGWTDVITIECKNESVAIVNEYSEIPKLFQYVWNHYSLNNDFSTHQYLFINKNYNSKQAFQIKKRHDRFRILS